MGAGLGNKAGHMSNSPTLLIEIKVKHDPIPVHTSKALHYGHTPQH